MKNKIAELLYKELDYPYCDNCRFCSEIKENKMGGCDDCHRKYMNWEISKSYSNYLAEKIKTLVQQRISDIKTSDES
jgi:hypothetical protein